MDQDFYRNIVFKKTKASVTSSSSEESLPKNISDSSKQKQTEIDDIKLSSRSKFLHLKNYLYFRCQDCDYNTKNGQDFERHLFQHDEETQCLEADATFCFEIEEKRAKIKEEKEKDETFKLSSIIEDNESQDLLEQSSE